MTLIQTVILFLIKLKSCIINFVYFIDDDGLKFLQMPDDVTVLEGHHLVKFICRSNDLNAQIKWLKV